MSVNPKRKITTKKLKPEEIKVITYDYRTNQMQIFNKEDLLIFSEITSEEYFNKVSSKFRKWEKSQ